MELFRSVHFAAVFCHKVYEMLLYVKTSLFRVLDSSLKVVARLKVFGEEGGGVIYEVGLPEVDCAAKFLVRAVHGLDVDGVMLDICDSHSHVIAVGVLQLVRRCVFLLGFPEVIHHICDKIVHGRKAGRVALFQLLA